MIKFYQCSKCKRTFSHVEHSEERSTGDIKILCVFCGNRKLIALPQYRQAKSNIFYPAYQREYKQNLTYAMEGFNDQ